MKKEREIQLADMHDNGVRFNSSLLAKKKRKEAQLKRIKQQLDRKSKAK
ncbi:hypothetical protein [Psychroflexus sp. ALD_RP9]|nr:hypothetical protein [Psychroflexus sp. ALD_RP9]QSS97329.1 hypothetical protein IMZ30_01020 [Psychroflexus sp. ALD_RP9]